MGYQSTFDQTYVCNDVNGILSGKVPVVVSYVAAFYSKRLGRCDCNVNSCGANNNLCVHGANDIKQGISQILDIYRSYAQGYANCFGTTKPIIFEMESPFLSIR